MLPENNPLFSEENGWNEDLKKLYCVKSKNGRPKKRKGQRLLPIIPLVGNAIAECYQANWPQYTKEDLDLLMERMDGRVDIVLKRLANQYFKTHNPFVRIVA